MKEKKTILVTGATGAQGGSVAKHLLAQGEFKIKGLTRHPDSEKAQALKKAGAEIVKGDLADKASIQAAVKGCYGVFGVTNFWEHFEKEFDHGNNLIEAVAAEPIEHFVFSSLADPKSFGKGDLDIPHFEFKARLEKRIKELKLKATIVHMAFYFENFAGFFPPQKNDDGSYSFGFPQGDTPLAAVSVEDLGGIVAPIFKNPKEYIGKVVVVAGDELKPAEYASIMSKVLGKNINYKHIPREVFAKFPFPGADDLANMFELYRSYFPRRDWEIAECRRLYPKMQTFESWLKANRDKFEAVFAGKTSVTA